MLLGALPSDWLPRMDTLLRTESDTTKDFGHHDPGPMPLTTFDRVLTDVNRTALLPTFRYSPLSPSHPSDIDILVT